MTSRGPAGEPLNWKWIFVLLQIICGVGCQAPFAETGAYNLVDPKQAISTVIEPAKVSAEEVTLNQSELLRNGDGSLPSELQEQVLAERNVITAPFKMIRAVNKADKAVADVINGFIDFNKSLRPAKHKKKGFFKH